MAYGQRQLVAVQRSGSFRGVSGHASRARAIGRTDNMEFRRVTVSTSFWLDARKLDYLSPFLGFIGDVLAEVGGRARKGRDAQAYKPVP
jgi:hypothetical protein